MKNEKVKIQISEQEWLEYPEEKKARIIELIQENYGWDISTLIMIDEGDMAVCPYCNDGGCDVCDEEEEEC